MALKSFSMKCIPRNQFHCDDNAFASASLTESHVLSVLTPIFPQVVLNLPFDFVLGKLPHPSDHASISTDDDGESISEPTIDIESIIKSMSPPECFGKQITPGEPENCSTPRNQRSTLILSPNPQFTPSSKKLDHPSTVENDEAWAINNFASEFLVGLLQVQSVNEDFAINSFVHMGQLLASLISKLKQITGKEVNALESSKKGTLKKFLLQCLLVKVSDFVLRHNGKCGNSNLFVSYLFVYDFNGCFCRAMEKNILNYVPYQAEFLRNPLSESGARHVSEFSKGPWVNFRLMAWGMV